jgi:Tfp pilus assembly protein PilF
MAERPGEDYAQALARELLSLGRRQQAEDAFRVALEQDPANARAYLGLAESLMEVKPREAYDYFRSAAELLPSLADAHNGLGCLSETPAAAESHFRRAAELEPTCAEFLSNLGMCLLEQGKTSEARSELEDALAMGAGYEISAALAELAFEVGDCASAEELLRPALSEVTVHNQFPREAWRHYEVLDFDAAEALFLEEAGTDDDPLWGWIFALYGKILLATDRDWPAARCLRTAIRLQPREAEYHRLLSEALASQKLTIKAGAARRRARQLARD